VETKSPIEWMPRKRWDALVRGENCPLCTAILSEVTQDEYGYTVADLRLSRLRLSANQSVAGYCVLICRRHVREPYELSKAEQSDYFQDMVDVGRALERVVDAVKMNFEILGNAIPHLHCHIKPRYYGDPAPGRPIDPDANVRLLDPHQYERQAGLIRDALGLGKLTT
jgi:diadenosine tetraphosphate (Ap4A) HIT family hydrolase